VFPLVACICDLFNRSEGFFKTKLAPPAELCALPASACNFARPA
jgi:hypothetical protein